MNNTNADLATKLCFPTILDGLRLLAANRGPTGSQFFKALWDESKYDAMCAFYLRPDGQWSISLYSTKETVDCSLVCKARQGGGHKGAAGFQAKELPFKVG
jgi:oligoribonuclease NrnB/cAMP/cGMP phosphodiesterase (DHH superfamily)